MNFIFQASQWITMDYVHETNSIDVLSCVRDAFILRFVIQEVTRKLVRKRNRGMREISRELSFIMISKKNDMQCHTSAIKNDNMT